MSQRQYIPEHSALDYLEEAFALLMRGGALPLIYYFIGALPFMLALLYFTAEMSAGAFAASHIGEGALLVSLAFGWMKTWQGLYARQLMRTIGVEDLPRLSFRETLRLGVTQYVVHSTGLFILPIAMLILFPFGWAYAFYQSITVNADTAPLGTQLRRAVSESTVAPIANHTALSVFSLIGFLLFVNLCILCYFFPSMIQKLSGADLRVLQTSGALVNSTVLMLIACLTYLLLDPLVKAFYVLRAFRIHSHHSGRDLLVRLGGFRRAASTAALALALLFVNPTSPLQASEPVPPPREEQIDRSIRDVLSRPEFAWRAPREKLPEEAEHPSWFARALKSLFHWIEGQLKYWEKEIKALLEWLFNRENEAEQKPVDFSNLRDSLTKVLYVLCGVIVLVAALMIWRSWRRQKQREIVELTSLPTAPDLTNEEVSADQLPPEGWESLAQEMIAKGEYRLATRAFYLSGLAHLSSREWITPGRAKSNRELRREITRRAPMHPELIEIFGQNILHFERVWYGEHPATAESVQNSQATLHELRQF